MRRAIEFTIDSSVGTPALAANAHSGFDRGTPRNSSHNHGAPATLADKHALTAIQLTPFRAALTC
jgi:hypothetical protein